MSNKFQMMICNQGALEAEQSVIVQLGIAQWKDEIFGLFLLSIFNLIYAERNFCLLDYRLYGFGLHALLAQPFLDWQKSFSSKQKVSWRNSKDLHVVTKTFTLANLLGVQDSMLMTHESGSLIQSVSLHQENSMRQDFGRNLSVRLQKCWIQTNCNGVLEFSKDQLKFMFIISCAAVQAHSLEMRRCAKACVNHDVNGVNKIDNKCH